MRTFRTFFTHKGISISPPRSIVSGGKLPIARENEMGGTLLSMSKLCPSVLPLSLPSLSLRGLGILIPLCTLRHKLLTSNVILDRANQRQFVQTSKRVPEACPTFLFPSSSAALKEVPIKNRKRQQLPCLAPRLSRRLSPSCPLLDLKCGAVILALSDTRVSSPMRFTEIIYMSSQAAT